MSSIDESTPSVSASMASAAEALSVALVTNRRRRSAASAPAAQSACAVTTKCQSIASGKKGAKKQKQSSVDGDDGTAKKAGIMPHHSDSILTSNSHTNHEAAKAARPSPNPAETTAMDSSLLSNRGERVGRGHTSATRSVSCLLSQESSSSSSAAAPKGERYSKRAKAIVQRYVPGAGEQPPPADAFAAETDPLSPSGISPNNTDKETNNISLRSLVMQNAFANHHTIVHPTLRGSNMYTQSRVSELQHQHFPMPAIPTPINQLPFGEVANLIPHNDKRLNKFTPTQLVTILQHHCKLSTTFAKSSGHLPSVLHEWATSTEPSKSSVRFALSDGHGIVFDSYDAFSLENSYSRNKGFKSLKDQLWKHGFYRPDYVNTGKSGCFPVTYLHEDDLFVVDRSDLAASIQSSQAREKAEKRELVLKAFYDHNPHITRPCF